jgi:hypothetical protein
MDSVSDPAYDVPSPDSRRRIVTDVIILITAGLFDIGVASASTGGDIDLVGFVIWGVALGSLMWRRRRPVTVLIITALGAIAFMAIGYRAVNIFPFILASYSAALYCQTKLQARIATLASATAVLAVFALATSGRGEFEVGDLVRNGLLLGAAFAVGNSIRT